MLCNNSNAVQINSRLTTFFLATTWLASLVEHSQWQFFQLFFNFWNRSSFSAEIAEQGQSGSVFLRLHPTFVELSYLVCIEGYLASQVRGFQSSFKFITSQDHTPYYEVMYYGATSKAIFGTLVAISYLVYVFACH
ncbi:hypothetical protein N7509_012755 [Penicillium cosmopolitanum]|uniref:Uncharacterized protein n=1 Tax=Penicillium cosmopolitanum TaxID=1131564 RepID=A0A9W9SJA6_9EURO|nr:uncharacterized protein N7509_012755 [Penicillium cosmopolitanum]KAJ5379636.1 hypothetical protein N7509_012755 [Penicillium cosmopolitanum]